jgi:hypothetical protein
LKIKVDDLVKEVIYLKKNGKKIPLNVEALFQNYDTYRIYQIELTYIINSYNEFIDNITELNYSVFKDEFISIDNEINKLINKLKWNSDGNYSKTFDSFI